MLGGIPYGDLSGWDDAAYAHEAKTMVQSGDLWTLHWNGNPDFDKPPLFIWLLAVSFKIFGITDFAAKVPGVLLGWATVITVYFLARELFSGEPEEPFADSSAQKKWLPVLAMLVMATTQYFLKYSSHAMTDVPFTFFFTLALYFYVRALKRDFFLLGSGACIGLATLVRSPMGLFPLGIIVLHLAFARRFKLLFSVWAVGCVLLALAIPATWFLTEYNLFGEVFINRHFGNFLAHSTDSARAATRTGWQHFLWYFEYLFLIVKLYLPWFPLMFYGLYIAARKMRSRFTPFENALPEALLVIWFFVVLIPFSLTDSKVLRYILPVFPAFAILSAYALCHLFSPKILAKFSRTAVVLLTVAAFITTASPKYLTRAGDMRSLAPITDAATQPHERILLYTSGEPKANYLTQLLWYGNRLCIFVKDIKEVETILATNKQTVVVMDKPTFEDLAARNKFQITILSDSENFICFRVVS